MGILDPQGGRMDPRTLSMLASLLQQQHPGAMPMPNAAPQIPAAGQGGGGGGVPYAPNFPSAQNGAGGGGKGMAMANNLGPQALLKMVQQGAGGPISASAGGPGGSYGSLMGGGKGATNALGGNVGLADMLSQGMIPP